MAAEALTPPPRQGGAAWTGPKWGAANVPPPRIEREEVRFRQTSSVRPPCNRLAARCRSDRGRDGPSIASSSADEIADQAAKAAIRHEKVLKKITDEPAKQAVGQA